MRAPHSEVFTTMSLSKPPALQSISTFDEFVRLADYSFMDSLNADPDATEDGDDHRARQVFRSLRTGDSHAASRTGICHPQQHFFLKNSG